MPPSTSQFRKFGFLTACVCAFVLIGCNATGGTPEPTASPAPTLEPSSTPTPTATVEQTEPPTAGPTATEKPAAGEITVSNAATLVELRPIEVSSTPISQVAFSPNDHHLATFGLSRSVDIWDADSGQLVTHLGTQADWGLGLAFSPDGTKLVSGSTGADVVVWDVVKGSKQVAVQAPPARIYGIAWSPDGDRFAVVGSYSSRMTVFGAGGNKIQEIKVPSGWLWSVAWSRHYLAVSNDTTQKAYIYDSTTYGSVGDVYAQFPTFKLHFSPDEKLLVGCLRTDGSMHVWDTSNLSEIASWEAYPPKGLAQGCISGEFSKDGSVYFTGGDDGNLIAWDIKTGDRLKTFEYGVAVWTISVSSDGKLVAAGLDNGQVKIIGLK